MHTILLFATFAFVAVVVLAAIICLLSLINIVKVDPYYQKRLFISVLLVIASITFSFVRQGLQPSPSPTLSGALSHQWWDWSYPEGCWRTHLSFSKVKDGITLVGDTYCSREGTKKRIIHWRGLRPIQLTGAEDQITLPVAGSWTEAGASEYPDHKYEVGKEIEGAMTLSMDVALRGQWSSTVRTEPWGMVFTKSWQ